MRAYLDILRNVLENGKWKGNRTGIRTLALPNQHFSHDMADGFPLLTTKRIAFKTMCVELEGFIKGITSKKWYQERKCKLWSEWANPIAVQRRLDSMMEEKIYDNFGKRKYQNPEEWRKPFQLKEDDLGPIYGYQWRRFGEAYDEDDGGVLEGYDQLKYIVNTLKNNPHDRRMVCSAWNPNQLTRMALPPCHLVWIVTVIDGELSLHWTQRSCDMALGVPLNIASYATLMMLLCKESGLRPGNLSGMLCDCHIYENQIPGVNEQLNRKPKELPHICITENKPFLSTDAEKEFDIFNWTHKDVALTSYNPHNKIDFRAVAV